MRLKEQKNIIMTDFNFEKVAKVMLLLDWKWVDGGVPGNFEYHPTVSDLKQVASDCLDHVINNSEEITDDNYSRGGFEALKIRGILELNFYIEKCNVLEHIFDPKK